MIDKFIKKLIYNIPISYKKEKIDLVLDGGAFNGSYQVGSLLFLKEMEIQGKIEVDKISGSSIGAISALLYHVDKLEMFIKFYKRILKYLKKYKCLKIVHSIIDNELKVLLPLNIHEQITNKIFISYYNVNERRKIIKSTYKNIDDVLDTIKRSSFLPFLINGDIVYKNKYLDGINPYVFNSELSKKILYIDLLGIDKIKDIFSLKNENTNYHRILTGILDIHLFFIKKTSTQMCSYVGEWCIKNWIRNYVIKYFFEKLIIYCILFYIKFKSYIPNQFNKLLFIQCLKKIGAIGSEFYIILFHHFCI